MTDEEKTENADAEKNSAISGSEVLAKVVSDLDHFLDIPLTIAVELGNAKMNVKDVIAFQAGNVIELNKLVGEPMEIYINGLVIARGEVVVVNERFGIRVTDVIDPLEVVRSSV